MSHVSNLLRYTAATLTVLLLTASTAVAQSDTLAITDSPTASGSPAVTDTLLTANKRHTRHLTVRQVLHMADSVRLHLRQSADEGRMLQWADSLLTDAVARSRWTERHKARFMRRYAKVQRRLARTDRLLFRGDSLLAANYSKVKYDTLYITRPNARWTIKLRGNLSGAGLTTKTNATAGSAEATPASVHRQNEVMADCRGTLSAAVAYRGLGLGVAVNPAKLAGKSQDVEFNLNSYSNRYGFDIVYLASKTYHGRQHIGDAVTDINKGQITQKALNINFYYAFNNRRFSFPAAFSQSYVQRHSAGSWMIGASFDGSKTVMDNAGNAQTAPVTIRLNEFAVGGGYGYNLVPSRHWLIHLSALPTLTVNSHDYVLTTTESAAETHNADNTNDAADTPSFTTQRTNMHYHFPSVIVTGRAAVVYSWRNKFAGATAVYNYSVAGNTDNLQLQRHKWRVRAFFGFRF